MHSHLVAVEIGIERGANERVQLDRFALDQHWFEGLNPETMERRRPIQQDGMLADDFLEDVPDLRPLLLDHALCGLDRAGEAIELELRVNERLEQPTRQ